MLHTLRQFELYDGTDFQAGTIPLHTWAVRVAAIIATHALDMKASASQLLLLPSVHLIRQLSSPFRRA